VVTDSILKAKLPGVTGAEPPLTIKVIVVGKVPIALLDV
jgi:hypothetical protein